MTEPESPALTVLDLFAARLDEEPDRVALVLDGERSLTLAEWDARSNAVAHGLLRRGVGRGDRVGLYFDGAQWIEYVVAYIAVQKAGAAAVPLSTRLAPGQVRFRLALCGAAFLVHSTAAPPPDVDLPTAAVEDLDGGDSGPVGVEVRPDDLAEVLFTSGTTGDSKGVGASHANITHGQQLHPAERKYANSRHLLCGFPIGTAAGQLSIMFSIVAAPTAVVVSRFDADAFARIIDALRVGTVILVPAMAIDLVNARVGDRHDLSSVLHLGCGGAALAPRMADRLAAMFPNAEVVNYYSSTEMTPILFTMPFGGQRSGSVGRPAAGVKVRIVGEDGEPLPTGETGEVCFRSSAPLREYYADPQATAHTFGSGWIRTGDFGYLDDDGYLFLVDRDKDVMKVGGLKVSTFQVEAALFEHSAVSDATVVGIPHPVMGRMVAAAVVLSKPVELTDLRAFLRERLADYELPTRIMVVDELPRGTMGKVLKREVREMFLSTPDVPRIPPSEPVEVEVSRMWTEVLDTPEVGVDDDFFALGGDSLKAARLAARVSDAFGVEVPASLVFDVPVLAHQAKWIAERSAQAGSTADPVPPGWGSGDRRASGPDGVGARRVPMSTFQERHMSWMVRGFTLPPTMPVIWAVRVTEPFDVEAFRRTLEELVGRHESLRTRIVAAGGGYEAVVHDDSDPHLTVTGVDGATPEERRERALQVAREYVGQRFEIVGGQLFRSLVVRMGEDDHAVVLNMDHMVSDLLSMEVLQREIAAVYPALRAGRPSPLPPLPLQESEYFAWVRGQYDRNRPYWERTLAGAPAAAGPLPGQDVRAARQSNRAVDFDVPVDLAERLRATYHGHGVTLFMAVMALWSTVLSRRTGAAEVVLTSPMSGRTRPEFEPLVGSILQSPFLRMRTDGDPTFEELFARARRRVVEAAEHQFFPHHEFVETVPYPARFSVEDFVRPPALPGVACEPFPLRPNLLSAQPVLGEADLNVPRLRLTARPDGTIAGMLSYNVHAFERAAVEVLARDFLRLVEGALEHPGQRVSEVA
jgi:acyl-CoA synthetase (AMP-forming)/AMP-acid ligase II/acyl carrier protein